MKVMEFATHTRIDWDQDPSRAWQQFGRGIATTLAAMTDEDILAVDMPGQEDPKDGGALPYIQVMSQEEGQARRCEVSSNDYLSPVYALSHPAQQLVEDELGFTLDRDQDGVPEGNYYRDLPAGQCPELAQVIVRVLREAFSVAHPRECHVEGGVALEDAPLPDPGGFPALDLSAEHEVETGWDALVLVHRTLHAALGAPAAREGGHWVLTTTAGRLVKVSLAPGETVVRLWMAPVSDITDEGAAAEQVDLLNADSTEVRYFLEDRLLVAQLDIEAVPLVPAAVLRGIETLSAECTRVTEAFAARTGGRTVTAG